MSNFGGPNSTLEKEYKRKFRLLVRQLKAAEDSIQAILITASQSNNASAAYWRGVDKTIKEQYLKMGKAYSTWTSREIPALYRDSLRQIQRKINSFRHLTLDAKKTITQVLASKVTAQRSAALVIDAIESFNNSLVAGNANVTRLTRATQQKLINESIIDATIAQGVEAGNIAKAVTSVSNNLIANLTDMAKNGRFVQAGSKRYRPRYYAELVVRTKFHEAQSFASIQQAVNYDTDLLLVSSHNTSTAICQEHEGKVYSISGQDKRFPIMTEVTPYHPNCLHLMFPTFVEAMELNGTLDGFSEFSKGNADAPPMPAGFVPVSDRTVKK